ncbi:lactate utilization protein C [Nitratireductor kimnyeongensis]|uniref:Lactate utilization protein C n=1 Tax=Nitratireductor kimnyeongensis TaxID=430679 RepID=A0ABW0T4T5_9HYPH|nr:lactate utilization protein [Nitratireductor kimnyeongensis]QZZ34646.1 lactate utilization protein [Nitratireductor kimnyeongensis]
MSGREAILGKLRAAASVSTDDAARREAVGMRLAKAPRGLIPARGQVDGEERIALFCRMAEAVTATVERVETADDVPKSVTNYLRSKNLAPSVRMGDDRRLKRMDWASQKSLEVKRGRAEPEDEVGVSHAFAAVAETGTVALPSGRENPTTVNFVPDHHIIVIDAKDIAGDLETVISRLRRKFGRGEMPRLLNLITGPSRSGDIEQTMLLGAHGPRALHLIVVDG